MAKKAKKKAVKRTRRSSAAVDKIILKIKDGVFDGTYKTAAQGCKANKMAYSQYMKFKNRVGSTPVVNKAEKRVIADLSHFAATHKIIQGIDDEVARLKSKIDKLNAAKDALNALA